MTDLMSKVQQALDTLSGVGGPDDIAGYLYTRGFRGKQYEPTMCPVHLYLKASVSGWPEVFMGPFASKTYVSWISDAGQRYSVNYPANVVEFVARFDKKHYKRLILKDKS